MTTSSINHPARPRAGFTLVEVMICSTIGSFVLLGLLSSYGLIVRSGTSLYNYVDMEQEARRGLEKFSEDSRMASAVAWTDNTRVTLTIPHVGSDAFANTVTYWWDTTDGSATYHCFRRQEAATDSTGLATTTTTTTLIHNVQSFQFDRWQAGGATGVQATADANTDQLQLHLTLRKQGNEFGRTSSAIVAASNLVVSARYILRNKS